MASMAELARQLLGMNGNSVGGVSPDRYMEIMDRSPYGTGVPLKIGYGEQDQMSPLDAAAMVTGGVPVVGDLTGLAADVDMYMRDPESRNIPNYLLTAAGVLPFLPAASQLRKGSESLGDAFKSNRASQTTQRANTVGTATKASTELAKKADVVAEYAASNPKAFLKIQKQVGKTDIEKQYVKVRAKQIASEKHHQDRVELENRPKKKPPFLHDQSKTQDILNELGFRPNGESVSKNFETGLPGSLSSYYEHPVTKASVRVSDHGPVYPRSYRNVMIHPGSFSSDLEIEQALRSAVKKAEGIKAYHGSPHDFPPVRELEMPDGAVVYQHMDDAVPEGASVIKEHPLGRFDMSKIGSGEGAQAYGRGLYFADREGTAKSYREALTRNQGNSSPSLFIDGKEAPLESIQDQTIREELQRYIDAWDDDFSLSGKDIDIDEAMDNIIFDAKQERSSRYTTEDEYPEIDQRIREAERLKTSGKLKIVDSGRMYEVNIDAKPDELLDWDIPISQQSKKVQDAVYANRDAVDQRIVDDYFGGDRNNIINDEMTGQKYMSNMDKVNAGMIDGTEYELAERGIKGVRYADGNSRGAGGGTSNYVIFDDRLITIAKKYGISIPAAAAMLARMTGEDTSQSYQEAS